MNPEQIEGLRRLERSGYLPVLRDLVHSHTGSFWWFDDSLPVGDSILHNGTITFVNTGDRTLGITANHVYEAYLDQKHHNPSIQCQIGNVRVEPEKYVSKIDASLDLVAFELPAVLVAATGVTIHNPVDWPPNQLEQGALVILGGYPGNRRLETADKANFDFVSFIGRVTQSSVDHFSMHLDIPNSFWPQGESVGDNPNLGGASGGPVFLIRTEPLETIQFAGVIYEYSETFEYVLARHGSQLCD